MLWVESLSFAPRICSSRVHAALTALVFVLASLAGFVHESTTRHVRCAEHGELVDAGTTTASAPTAATDDDGRTSVQPGGPTASEHEHCALASAMRTSPVVSRSPALAPTRVAIVTLSFGHARATPPVASLYRTAPKTSPPA